MHDGRSGVCIQPSFHLFHLQNYQMDYYETHEINITLLKPNFTDFLKTQYMT